MSGIAVTEGSIGAKEAEFLASLVAGTEPMLVVQTGLGYGRSAWAFLEANPNVRVVSFDLCEHAWVTQVAAVLHEHFPGRHILARGDSRETIPHRQDIDDRKLVFVDGGHDFDTALADLRNLRMPGCRVVIDDLLPQFPGVTNAWAQALADGLLVQEGFYDERTEHGYWGWGVGRYA
jgi:predicted O-methyltransferase YrrM